MVMYIDNGDDDDEDVGDDDDHDATMELYTGKVTQHSQKTE